LRELPWNTGPPDDADKTLPGAGGVHRPLYFPYSATAPNVYSEAPAGWESACSSSGRASNAGPSTRPTPALGKTGIPEGEVVSPAGPLSARQGANGPEERIGHARQRVPRYRSSCLHHYFKVWRCSTSCTRAYADREAMGHPRFRPHARDFKLPPWWRLSTRTTPGSAKNVVSLVPRYPFATTGVESVSTILLQLVLGDGHSTANRSANDATAPPASDTFRRLEEYFTQCLEQ
jgi:hypothetical protein